MMTRSELGERMLQWHGGQGDPVYAVGSFYVDDNVYPRVDIVDDALFNLRGDLFKYRKMERGIPVMVERFGKMVSLKEFAGYHRKELREHVKDLREIVAALEAFKAHDYSPCNREADVEAASNLSHSALLEAAKNGAELGTCDEDS